jgi:hypothetical protein
MCFDVLHAVIPQPEIILTIAARSSGDTLGHASMT